MLARYSDIAAQSDLLAPESQAAPLAERLAGRRGTDGALVGARPLSVGDKPARLRRLRQEVEACREVLVRSGKPVVSLVSAPRLGVAELRAIARREKATIVEYYSGADALYGFTIAVGGAIHAFTVPVSADDLRARVAAARSGLGVPLGRALEDQAPAPAPTPIRSDLQGLYRLLIGPLEKALPPGGPLCIVPHRSLFLLPFAALVDGRGKYLVEAHAIRMLPAIGVLRYTRAPDAAPGRPLLVGNPTMPKLPRGRLAPLPGAESEAKRIAALLKAFRPQCLIGASAQESRVLRAMSAARWIHLATHGKAQDDDALRSYVALAPDRRPGRNGLLTAEQIFQLKLHASLVTLSACQTGLGRVTGDGVMGLGRAFIYAGTPSVVVSLWSVSDEATAFEMVEFYRRLAAGVDKEEALRQAQLATLKRYPNPQMWAPFVLVGEGGKW